MKIRTLSLLGLTLMACAEGEVDRDPPRGDGGPSLDASLDAEDARDDSALAPPRDDLNRPPRDVDLQDATLIDAWPAPRDQGAWPPRDAWIERDAQPERDARPPRDARPEEDARPRPDLAVETEDAAPALDAAPGCVYGGACDPILIEWLPFIDEGDTRGGEALIPNYDCAPNTDERGPEIHYQLDLDEPGQLSIAVEDAQGIDIDIHLLQGGRCLARADSEISARVEPGRYEIVADTWVNSAGEALAGPYTLRVGFAAVPSGACATEALDLRMFWGSCAAGVDCYEAGGERFLRTPATGPVVKEAHLVTVEDGFGAGWPSTSREGLAEHYARSQAATGYVMARAEAWAPAGEGGSEYGQGSTGAKLPLVAEAWYVNMYWRDRPAAGTRMIISNPANGRAVVAAAGYETGPGDNSMIGGVTEEIHDHLGTGHRGVLTLGFALDQDLPYGPIDCQ
ncbi:hypothetical protein KKB55_22745 [Myxococcota bacterium]|nr:hypothetical protein [Myxococcota bacterium]MBU1900574.1 hypothetical protein [Myxococcota bacterium]